MGFVETEGQTIDEYVAIAKKLATDAEYRSHISNKVCTAKHLAYNDLTCIRGLEDFLKTAVASYR